MLIRGEDDGLLGLGTRDSEVVHFNGVGTEQQYDLTSELLRSQLEHEYKEQQISFDWTHQEIDGQAHQKVLELIRILHSLTREMSLEEAIQHLGTKPGYHRDNIVDFSETKCFETLLFVHGLYEPEDFMSRTRLEGKEHFEPEDFEGCLKVAPGPCISCAGSFHILTGYEWNFRFSRHDKSFHNMELQFHKMKLQFIVDHPECFKGGEIADLEISNIPTYIPSKGQIVCPNDVRDRISYWNHQRSSYLPTCQLMLDTSSPPPWRMSGLCSHKTGGTFAADYDVRPESGSFWDAYESRSGGFEYNHGDFRRYQQYVSYEFSFLPSWGDLAMLGKMVLINLLMLGGAMVLMRGSILRRNGGFFFGGRGEE